MALRLKRKTGMPALQSVGFNRDHVGRLITFKLQGLPATRSSKQRLNQRPLTSIEICKFLL